MRIFRILLLLVPLAFSFAPFTVRAGCCVCGEWETKSLINYDHDKATKVNVCFAEGGTMNENYCTTAGAVIGNMGNITTQKKGGFYCLWYTQECSAFNVNSLRCPDIKGDLLLGQTLKALNIELPPVKKIEFRPSISIPGSSTFIAGKKIEIDASTVAKYITDLYKFIIGSIGFLAVAGIMIGGFQYLMGAGSPDKISEAKTSITSAIVGLVIALTSYLILSTVSNDLVDFTRGLTSLTPIAKQIYNNFNSQQLAGNEINACTAQEEAVSAFTVADFPDFGGNVAIASSIDARLRREVVNSLNAAATKDPVSFTGAPMDGSKKMTLVEWLKSKNLTLQINSAFRTSQKQFELRNCYEYSITSNLCPYNCTGCNEAAEQRCTAPHQDGWALDICLSGANAGDAKCGSLRSGTTPSNEFVILQHYLQTVGGFKRYCREAWHFEHAGYGVLSCRCDPGNYSCVGSGPSETADDPP